MFKYNVIILKVERFSLGQISEEEKWKLSDIKHLFNCNSEIELNFNLRQLYDCRVNQLNNFYTRI